MVDRAIDGTCRKVKGFNRVDEQEEKGVRVIPCVLGRGRTAFVMKVCGKCGIQLVLKKGP